MAIRKASRKYNSDFMSRYCDEQLEQLEDRLTALYANANNKVLDEFNSWMSRYEKNYNIMLKKLESEEITKKEFKKWVKDNILNNDSFKKNVNSMADILVKTDIEAVALVDSELPIIIAESYNFIQFLGYESMKEAGKNNGK